MKLQFETKNFKRKIDSVGRAARKNNLQTVLSNIYFKIDNNQIEMTGTDNVLYVKEKMEADNDLGQSEFLIPASKLQEIVSVTKSDSIALSFDGQKCSVKAGSTRFNLSLPETTGYPASEDDWAGFPSKSFKIDSADFCQSLTALVLTTNASTKFSGIHFEWKSRQSEMRLASTDGAHCCVCLSKIIPLNLDGDFFFVLPLSTAETLLASLKGHEGDIEVEFVSQKNSGKVRFRFGSTTIQSVLAASPAFPYESVIFKSSKLADVNFVFSPDELSQLVRELGVVNDTVFFSLFFDINPKSVHIYGSDPQSGADGETELVVETGAEETIKLKLDGKRFAQGIRAIQAAECSEYRFLFKRFLNLIGYDDKGEIKVVYSLGPQENKNEPRS